jgi:Flp pilus assembly protein CpaB
VRRIPWRVRWALARRRRLLAAGLLAAAAAVGVRAATPQPSPTEKVPVATRDLPAGHVLNDGDLAWQRWPAGTAPRGRLAVVGGQVLGGAVRQGEVLTDARVLGAGLLAGQDADVVAVVVRPAEPASAAVVHAGDRVDVLAGPAGVDPLGPRGVDRVARDAVVLARLPDGALGAVAAGSDGWGASAATPEGPGALVLGVRRGEAELLAGAAGSRPLTVALLPSP